MIRLGVRLGAAVRRGAVWRRVAMVAGGAVVAVCALSALSIIDLNDVEQDRESARTGVLSSEPAGTDIFALQRFDNIDGRQFPVNWVGAAEPGAAAVAPPGISDIPAPGTFAVSPALDRLLQGRPDSERYEPRVVISPEGVRTGEELFAYAGAAATELAANDVEVPRIGSLDGTPNTPYNFTFGIVESADPLATALGVTVFLIVPAVGVLVVAAMARSPRLESRLAVLEWLGAGTRRRAVLVATETAVGLVPGIAIGTLLWWIGARSMTSVPVLHHGVFRGDLLPSPRRAAATLAAALVTGVAIAVWRFARRQTRADGSPRPVRRGIATSRWLVIPGLAGITLVAIGAGESRFGVKLYAGGLLTLIGLPSLTRLLLSGIGEWVRSIDRPSALLAGGRLARDPERSARLLIGLGMLLFVGLTVVGFRAVTATVDPPRPVDDDLQTLTIASDLTRGSVEELRGLLPDASVVQIARLDDGSAVAVDPCGGPICVTADQLSLATGVPFEMLATADSFPENAADSDTLVVGRRGPIFDAVAKNAVADVAPLAAYSNENDLALHKSPLDAYLTAGMTVMAIVTACAFALGIIDRYSADERQARTLAVVGLTPNRIARVETLQFALSFAATVGLGATVGSISLLLIALPQPEPFPLVGLVATVGAASLLGVVATAGVWVLARQSATRLMAR